MIKVQRGESGRSPESGRSIQKWTVFSQTGRSFEPECGVDMVTGFHLVRDHVHGTCPPNSAMNRSRPWISDDSWLGQL